MLQRSNIKGIDFSDEVDMTDQSCLVDCSIRGIIDRYRFTGQTPFEVTKDMFGDASVVTDYNDALLLLKEHKEQFDELPSSVRDYFKNDPRNMLEFFSDPSNIDKAVEAGFLLTEEQKCSPATPVAGAREDVITSPLEPSTAQSGAVE